MRPASSATEGVAKNSSKQTVPYSNGHQCAGNTRSLSSWKKKLWGPDQQSAKYNRGTFVQDYVVFSWMDRIVIFYNLRNYFSTLAILRVLVIILNCIFFSQILNQGSAPMNLLESHTKQFVACKLAPKAPGCESRGWVSKETVVLRRWE